MLRHTLGIELSAELLGAAARDITSGMAWPASLRASSNIVLASCWSNSCADYRSSVSNYKKHAAQLLCILAIMSGPRYVTGRLAQVWPGSKARV